MSRLENKVAVITGAAQSIGLACASVFLCEGAKVVLADIDSALGEASAADLQKTYPDRVLFVKTDVTKDADLEALFRRAVDTFGGVDALVCSAAIFVLKGASASREDWAKSLGVNVVSAARTVYYFGEAFSSTRGQEAKMKPRGKGGAIVLFASISAYIAQPEFVS
jgi:NAD(P)-dependent dehydrogenase (short-subunit alcohol dehydrogenase family)